jgi:sugar phosphate isomerase/epimerase
LQAARAWVEDAALRAGTLVLVPGGMPAGGRDIAGARARVVEAVAEQFPRDAVGVTLDTFHLWWEPGILGQIRRAGDRILSYQISD